MPRTLSSEFAKSQWVSRVQHACGYRRLWPNVFKALLLSLWPNQNEERRLIRAISVLIGLVLLGASQQSIVVAQSSIGVPAGFLNSNGLKIDKAWFDATKNIVPTSVASLASTAPPTVELVLQLSDGQAFRFGNPLLRNDIANGFSGKFVDLPKHFDGQGSLVVRSTSAPGTIIAATQSFKVRIDIVPPKITSVRAMGDEYGARMVEFTLEDENLNESYSDQDFTVKSLANGGDVLVKATPPALFSVVNKRINVPINPTAGLLSVRVTKDLKDSFGNALEPFSTTIAGVGQRGAGPAVDFPPNVVPQNAGPHSDSNLIRPSSRVVTRVVKLYYYRDAHRVAEIINRRTQQWNLANVQAKRGLANQAADDAAIAVEQRRQSQREAEQAARRTREAERELQQQQVVAEEAQAVRNSLASYPDGYKVVRAADGRLTVVPDSLFAAETGGSTTVKTFKEQLNNEITSFNDKKAKVDELKRTEEDLNNKARALEDKESRLVRAQFLKEVDAAHEDPNTYAPGNIQSVDPIMQTSVSVIGEGVIQLRGPIDGINQIRRMIHEIDTPVGQVKVDLETVQINGEKGGELEKSVQLVEGYINSGRFLTNQCLVLLTRSVAEVASEVATEFGEPWGRDQMGRDMRYLYGFFGQDFVDTLYRMDSEFLHTENQILSLHSMDSISRNRCLLLLGLAKNSVRQRILQRFQQYVQTCLPEMEYQYRTVNKAIPCQYLPDCCEECKEKVGKFLHPKKVECPRYCVDMAMMDAQRNYLFLNFQNFFAQGEWNDATLNPMQREFIRMAQIFKSQMIAEIELKQRVVERGLMDQNRSDDEQSENNALKTVRNSAAAEKVKILDDQRRAIQGIGEAVVKAISSATSIDQKLEAFVKYDITRLRDFADAIKQKKSIDPLSIERLSKIGAALESVSPHLLRSIEIQSRYEEMRESKEIQASLSIKQRLKEIKSAPDIAPREMEQVFLSLHSPVASDLESRVHTLWQLHRTASQQIKDAYQSIILQAQDINANWNEMMETLSRIKLLIPEGATDWHQAHDDAQARVLSVVVGRMGVASNTAFLNQNRLPLENLKLLDHLIDEHQEKAMDLLEGKRAHISAIDNFLKRMTFAMEDDFQVQFYDPSLACIRAAARGKRVTLSQVERTTVLGNNRELLKVLPQATMEFDLPHRQLRVTEAMQGAKALVDDYGALLNDPTFLAAFQMMGGNVQAESIRKVTPGLTTEENHTSFQALPNGGSPNQLGASLQSLVPDPAIYQFETGTGFEVRPVIQPDGDSLVYDLNYMYTTELREPVRADEKHLGRIKRHFLNTQVQTSSFELREVGRYQVALKAARTARGVPMLENVPVIGAAFRPAPSEESSIQQNILLAKSVVYPTLYDLMGLAWAQHVAELGYDEIRNSGHVVRGRQRIIRQHVFDKSSSNVDNFLQINAEDKDHYRPDLYREHSAPSPYHPNGYIHPGVRDDQDPTRRGFRVPDPRPDAYKSGVTNTPAEDYDTRFRMPAPPPSDIQEPVHIWDRTK
jgi:hypothetical protein